MDYQQINRSDSQTGDQLNDFQSEIKNEAAKMPALKGIASSFMLQGMEHFNKQPQMQYSQNQSIDSSHQSPSNGLVGHDFSLNQSTTPNFQYQKQFGGQNPVQNLHHQNTHYTSKSHQSGVTFPQSQNALVNMPSQYQMTNESDQRIRNKQLGSISDIPHSLSEYIMHNVQHSQMQTLQNNYTDSNQSSSAAHNFNIAPQQILKQENRSVDKLNSAQYPGPTLIPNDQHQVQDDNWRVSNNLPENQNIAPPIPQDLSTLTAQNTTQNQYTHLATPESGLFNQNAIARNNTIDQLQVLQQYQNIQMIRGRTTGTTNSQISIAPRSDQRGQINYQNNLNTQINEQKTLNELKNRDIASPLGTLQTARLPVHNPLLMPNIKNVSADYLNAAKQNKLSKQRKGDRNDKQLKKNKSTSRKGTKLKDSSHQTFARNNQMTSLSNQRSTKSRNTNKLPRSGSNRGKKKQVFNQYQVQNQTYSGDIRQDYQFEINQVTQLKQQNTDQMNPDDEGELHNDSDVIEESGEIDTQNIDSYQYNSPNFHIVPAHQQSNHIQDHAKQNDILIDVQNSNKQQQQSPNTQSNMQDQNLLQPKKTQVDSKNLLNLNQCYSEEPDDKIYKGEQHSQNTMSIEEHQLFQEPHQNDSFINTISIQESSTIKDHNLIGKLSQIASKQSLNSKVSAAVASSAGKLKKEAFNIGQTGYKSTHEAQTALSKPTADSATRDQLFKLQIKNQHRVPEKQLSQHYGGPTTVIERESDKNSDTFTQSQIQNSTMNNRLDHNQKAKLIGSNEFHKFDSSTLRDMLMKNNLSSRDQREFQKEFDEFQEELKKRRSSDSRNPEFFDQNQLSKSNQNDTDDLAEASAQMRNQLLMAGKHQTPAGLSNYSDSQTITASLGFNQSSQYQHLNNHTSKNFSLQKWSKSIVPQQYKPQSTSGSVSNNLSVKNKQDNDLNSNQYYQGQQRLQPSQNQEKHSVSDRYGQQNSSQSNQIFTDAIRLGSAVNQMLSMYKKKHWTFKRQFFEKWKLLTLLTTANKVNRRRYDLRGQIDSQISNSQSYLNQSKSDSSSDLIHIIHQTRNAPILIEAEQSNSALDQSESCQELSDSKHHPFRSDYLQTKNQQELIIRKSIMAIFRYKSRKTAQNFYRWKFEIIFQKRFDKQLLYLKSQMESEYQIKLEQFQLQLQGKSTNQSVQFSPQIPMTPGEYPDNQSYFIKENLSQLKNDNQIAQFENQQEDIDEDQAHRPSYQQDFDQQIQQSNNQSKLKPDENRVSVNVPSQSEDYCEENVFNGNQREIQNQSGANYKMINQMKAKLPFSGGDSKRDLQDAYKIRAELERAELQDTFDRAQNENSVDQRVADGLVPAQSNKSKQLSQEQQIMFKKVLQSSQKNFKTLLNIDEDSGSELNHHSFENLDQPLRQLPDPQIQQKNRLHDPSQSQIAKLGPTNKSFQNNLPSYEQQNKLIVEYQDELMQQIKLKHNLGQAIPKLNNLLYKSRITKFLRNFGTVNLGHPRFPRSGKEIEMAKHSIVQLVSSGAFKNYIVRQSKLTSCKHYQSIDPLRNQILEIFKPILMCSCGMQSGSKDNHYNQSDILETTFHMWKLQTVLQIPGLKQTLELLVKQSKALQGKQTDIIADNAENESNSSQKLNSQNPFDRMECLQCFVEINELQFNSLRAIGVVQGIIRRSQNRVISKFFHRWKLHEFAQKKESNNIYKFNSFGTSLQTEMHQKMIMNLNFQKKQSDVGINDYYARNRKIKIIINKFNQYKQLLTLKSMQDPQLSQNQLESKYQTAGLKTGLTIDDFDYLLQLFPNIEREAPSELPWDLTQKLQIYKYQLSQFKGFNRKEKVEKKVRQMCYDMIVKVLEIKETEREKIAKQLQVHSQLYSNQNQLTNKQKSANYFINNKK